MENVSLSDIKFVYDRMQDEISRNIYSERLFYNMGGEGKEQRIRRIMDVQGTSIHLLRFLERHKEYTKVLFGAGYWGKQILRLFPEAGWRFFVDNHAVHGKMVEGLACYSLDEILREDQNVCFVVATSKFTEEIMDQLISRNVQKENIFVLQKHMEILEGKYQYFDLSALPHDSEEIFVDVGALDGATTEAFISWTSNQYSHIYMFEPNPFMKDKIHKELKDIPNVTLISKAVSDEAKEELFCCGESGHEGCSHIVNNSRSDVHRGGGKCLFDNARRNTFEQENHICKVGH